MPTYTLPHIDISNRMTAREYQAPQEARGGGSAPRIREQHGQRLERELAAAFGQADQDRDGDERLPPATGVYLEVELRRGDNPLAIERKKSRLEPGAAQKADDDKTRIAFFVPDEARPVLEEILRDYTTGQLTEKGRPPRKAFVDPIETIRQARLETFWTDDPQALPARPQDEIWWELWCSKGKEEQARNAAEILNARVADNEKWLRFPEVTVVPVLASRATIELMLFAAIGITELRRASATPALFLEEDRQQQFDRAVRLAERVTWPGNDVPAVCLFDTGVNRGHILIEPALREADAKAVREEWLATDERDGHGTGMAGLALFGDLTDALRDDREIVLEHRIESVKVLPPDGFPPNEPATYGPITQAATAIGELMAPERPRVFCMAVTNENVSGARSTTWSAAIDQAASGTMDGDEEGAPRRLFVVSAGNAPPEMNKDRTLEVDDYPIEDPAQAWNALTVGGYTDKIDIRDEGFEDWTPFADAGEISPDTRSSASWPSGKSPFKPEILMEAGNRAVSPSQRDVSNMDSLSLLTTGANVDQSPLVDFSATSAATAQAARLAARLSARFPDLWPETIRALIIHSAEWTPPMRAALDAAANKREACRLLRRFGYGVPTFERAAQQRTILRSSPKTPSHRSRAKADGNLGTATSTACHGPAKFWSSSASATLASRLRCRTSSNQILVKLPRSTHNTTNRSDCASTCADALRA
jgi:Subtilase family